MAAGRADWWAGTGALQPPVFQLYRWPTTLGTGCISASVCRRRAGRRLAYVSWGCRGRGGRPANFNEVRAMAHGAHWVVEADADHREQHSVPTRRDFLMLATGALGAFGVAAVA